MEKAANKAVAVGTTLVIFGISGDLARRYILPALASLNEQKLLPADFKIVGVSRRQIGASNVLSAKTKALDKYLQLVTMDMSETHDYRALSKELSVHGQTIFYLSVPPAAVLPILHHLSKAGLNHGNTKLLLEKPFGYDLESARELVAETKHCFSEDQIYRIDHYMAKEMAQNISVFLGSNALFRNIWNKDFIESIDVIAAERLGVEGRANFYESTGALRDFVQSHLLNLAALTLMRPCASQSEFEEMPDRRLEVLRSLAPADPEQAVRAQYNGYRQDVANPHSVVETFASVTIFSNDSRWAGVPIRLTTGKKLNAKTSEIRVRFKKADESQANILTLRIQPQEGVEIDLWAKQPGFANSLRHLPLTFSYSGGERLPDAYERVLIDAINSRASLFATSDEVLETWRVLQPLIERWSAGAADLKTYQPGSTLEQALGDKA